MLQAFGHHVATCCDMLRAENRTSAHAQAQHCCTNLAKQLQHDATFTNVAWKIWPFSNLSQQHPTCRNRVAKSTQHVAPNNVAICCVEMLRSFGRGLIFNLRILREFTLIQFVYTVRNIPNLTEYLRWRQISKKKFKNWPPSRICGRTWLFHVDGKEMNKKL